MLVSSILLGLSLLCAAIHAQTSQSTVILDLINHSRISKPAEIASPEIRYSESCAFISSLTVISTQMDLSKPIAGIFLDFSNCHIPPRPSKFADDLSFIAVINSNSLKNCKLGDYARQVAQVPYVQAIILYEDDDATTLRSFEWKHDNKTFVVRVPTITGEFVRRFMVYAEDRANSSSIRCRMNEIGQAPYFELAGTNKTGFSEPYAIRGLLDFTSGLSKIEEDDTVPIWRLSLMVLGILLLLLTPMAFFFHIRAVRIARDREALILANFQEGHGNAQLLQPADLEAYPAFEFHGPESVETPTAAKVEMQQVSKPEEEMPLNVVIQVEEEEEASKESKEVTREKSRQSTSARDGETVRNSVAEGPSGERSRNVTNLPLVAKQGSTLSVQNDKLVCSICLESYETGEKLRKLPCQHTFHAECVDMWLTKKSGTCPLCRTQLKRD